MSPCAIIYLWPQRHMLFTVLQGVISTFLESNCKYPPPPSLICSCACNSFLTSCVKKIFITKAALRYNARSQLADHSKVSVKLHKRVSWLNPVKKKNLIWALSIDYFKLVSSRYPQPSVWVSEACAPHSNYSSSLLSLPPTVLLPGAFSAYSSQLTSPVAAVPSAPHFLRKNFLIKPWLFDINLPSWGSLIKTQVVYRKGSSLSWGSKTTQ